jgi:hypothetical protein
MTWFWVSLLLYISGAVVMEVLLLTTMTHQDSGELDALAATPAGRILRFGMMLIWPLVGLYICIGGGIKAMRRPEGDGNG